MPNPNQISIPIFSRSVYGRTHFYPADKAQAEALALLTDQKTLSQAHLRGLQKLGFALVEITEPEPVYPLPAVS